MAVSIGLDATVQFRTSSKIKKEAFEIFEAMGISPSAAFQLFLQQVRSTGTLPFIVTANFAMEEKEEGYDEWLRARLERTIKMLDSGEMKSFPIEEVEARLKARRDEYRKQLKNA